LTYLQHLLPFKDSSMRSFVVNANGGQIATATLLKAGNAGYNRGSRCWFAFFMKNPSETHSSTIKVLPGPSAFR
jgi:hypothetical protein